PSHRDAERAVCARRLESCAGGTELRRYRGADRGDSPPVLPHYIKFRVLAEQCDTHERRSGAAAVECLLRGRDASQYESRAETDRRSGRGWFGPYAHRSLSEGPGNVVSRVMRVLIQV